MLRRGFIAIATSVAGLSVAAPSLAQLAVRAAGASAQGDALPSTAVRVAYGMIFDIPGFPMLDDLWTQMYEGELLDIASCEPIGEDHWPIAVYRQALRIGFFSIHDPHRQAIESHLTAGGRLIGRLQCLHPSGTIFAELFAPDGPIASVPPLRLSDDHRAA